MRADTVKHQAGNRTLQDIDNFVCKSPLINRKLCESFIRLSVARENGGAIVIDSVGAVAVQEMIHFFMD
jgi:hypothetical protein